MTDREEFEKFALSKGWSIQRKNEGYLWESVQAAWDAWQALGEAKRPEVGSDMEMTDREKLECNEAFHEYWDKPNPNGRPAYEIFKAGRQSAEAKRPEVGDKSLLRYAKNACQLISLGISKLEGESIPMPAEEMQKIARAVIIRMDRFDKTGELPEFPLTEPAEPAKIKSKDGGGE